MVISSVKHGV